MKSGVNVFMTEDFNPRSRTGSDVNIFPLAVRHTNFNPRSRTGSDGIDFMIHHGDPISIHAPARGATYDSGKP